MNCAVCSRPIDKDKGYYLLTDAPHCTDCFHQAKEYQDIKNPEQSFADGWESDNLLEAFRVYQARVRNSVHRHRL